MIAEAPGFSDEHTIRMRIMLLPPTIALALPHGVLRCLTGFEARDPVLYAGDLGAPVMVH